VQRTGVAIETQGFTFVTSGRKRESLTVSKSIHNIIILMMADLLGMPLFRKPRTTRCFAVWE